MKKLIEPVFTITSLWSGPSAGPASDARERHRNL